MRTFLGNQICGTRAVFAYLFIVTFFNGNAQTIIDVGHNVSLDIRKEFFISEVYSTQERVETIGVIARRKQNEIPILVRGGMEEAVRSACGRSSTEGTEMAMQIQRFWITEDPTIAKDDYMRLDSRILFFKVDESKAKEEKYEHILTYEKCFYDTLSTDSEDLYAFIGHALNHAFDSLSVACSTASENVLGSLYAQSLEVEFMEDGLSPDHIQKLKGVTGVIDNFENLLALKIHTQFEVKRRANQGGDAYFVKIKGVPSDYENWGVVIDGVIYKKCQWGYQEMKGDKRLTTFISPTGSSGALVGAIMFGLVGAAVGEIIDEAGKKME